MRRKVEGARLVWFGDPSCGDVDLVGGKAAHLSRLAASYRVPPGFCLTTWALRGAGPEGEGPLGEPLRSALAAAYHALGQRVGDPAPSVAVRSSAADEDGAGTSFAGQHETLLNVVGLEAVCAAVRRCWASACAPRALEYRRRQRLPEDGIRLAVLVQQLVAADVSAVAFSANPLTQARDEVVINATWGLGESMVGGTVTPDTYIVRDADGAVVRQVASKQRMTVPGPSGTREVGVPRPLREYPALSEARAREVAALARSLERAMGWPVDLECAYRGDLLYLLQCRPITTLSTAEGRN